MIDLHLVWRSLPDAFRKLDPRVLWKNPVMFVVEIGSVLTTFLFIRDPSLFAGLVIVWLWLTVLFANLAEAVAEGRGKAQAATLRAARQETLARRLRADGSEETGLRTRSCSPGDRCVVEAGEIIPGDGEVVEGVASVDESAITGESAPGDPRVRWRPQRRHRRHEGAVGPHRRGDHVEAGRDLHRPDDRVGGGRAAAEDAERDRAEHPAWRASRSSSCSPPSRCSRSPIYSKAEQTVVVLVALLVCLIPTTIGALLSAIGIAGMDRLVQRNVLAMSGRAVEAAGDVNTLLLDKTGTITLGNRQAAEFLPAPGVTIEDLADAAQLTSLADETPEGRSIVVLAKEHYGLRGRDVEGAEFVPFTAQTRMSGVDMDGHQLRKGAADSVRDMGGRAGRRGSRRRSTPSWPASRSRAARRSRSPATTRSSA